MFSTEDLESQNPHMSGVTHYAPFLGSEPVNMEGMFSNGKAWTTISPFRTQIQMVPLPDDSENLRPLKTRGWIAKSVATNKIEEAFTFIFNAKIKSTKRLFDVTEMAAAKDYN